MREALLLTLLFLWIDLSPSYHEVFKHIVHSGNIKLLSQIQILVRDLAQTNRSDLDEWELLKPVLHQLMIYKGECNEDWRWGLVDIYRDISQSCQHLQNKLTVLNNARYLSDHRYLRWNTSGILVIALFPDYVNLLAFCHDATDAIVVFDDWLGNFDGDSLVPGQFETLKAKFSQLMLSLHFGVSTTDGSDLPTLQDV